jgi:hypothetical protein
MTNTDNDVRLTLTDRETLLLQTLAGINDSVATAVVSNSFLHSAERDVEASKFESEYKTGPRAFRKAQKDEIVELLRKIALATHRFDV